MRTSRRHLLTPSVILLVAVSALGVLVWGSLGRIEEANREAAIEVDELLGLNGTLQALAEYALHIELTAAPVGRQTTTIDARGQSVALALDRLVAGSLPAHKAKFLALRAEFGRLRENVESASSGTADRMREIEKFDAELRRVAQQARDEAAQFAGRTAATLDASRRIAVAVLALSLIAAAVALRLALKHLREREAAQLATEHSEQRLRSLLLGLADGVIVHEGKEILLMNPAARDLVSADGGAALLQERRQREKHETVRIRAASGDERVIDVTAGSILFQRHDARILLLRDVSERAELQQRVAHSERLAAVGTLAAGVAHEINNPTAFILANLEFALERLGEPEALGEADLRELTDALGDAKDGAKRVAAIVKDLKLVARAEPSERKEVNVKTVVERSARLIAGALKASAQLTVDVPDELLVVASETHLAQIFTNLLVNAAQAIPAGDSARNRVTVRGRMEGRLAVIDVSDTGAGIPAECLNRIFEPFFTTKPVGEGTGLGLSISRGLLRDLGGDISVTSEPGKGTTFRVTLPAAPVAGEAKRSAQALSGAAAQPARSRVLVIDDEPNVGAAVARALGQQHEVVVAADASKGLEACSQRAFDVILCDIVMPQVDGAEFYRRLNLSHPAMARRTLFMTGATFSAEPLAFLNDAGRTVIEKPFNLGLLRSEIDRLLRRAPSAVA